MNHWLLKSEPDVFSFADLKARGREPWSGVRNFLARNYMRDLMRPGDTALFYHSSCASPGVAGLMQIASPARPDPAQFEQGGEYFEPRASPEKPVWFLVDVAWWRDLPHFVSLERMKQDAALADMIVLRRGNRLSITPVTAAEFRRVCRLGGLKI